MVQFKDFEPSANVPQELRGLQYGVEAGMGKLKFPSGKTFTFEILNIPEGNPNLVEAEWQKIALQVALILQKKHLLEAKTTIIGKENISSGEKVISHTDTSNSMINTVAHADEIFQFLSSKFLLGAPRQIPVQNLVREPTGPQTGPNREPEFTVQVERPPSPSNKAVALIYPSLEEQFKNSVLFIKIIQGNTTQKSYISYPLNLELINKSIEDLKEKGDFVIQMCRIVKDPISKKSKPLSEVAEFHYKKETYEVIVQEPSVLPLEVTHDVKKVDIDIDTKSETPVTGSETPTSGTESEPGTPVEEQAKIVKEISQEVLSEEPHSPEKPVSDNSYSLMDTGAYYTQEAVGVVFGTLFGRFVGPSDALDDVKLY